MMNPELIARLVKLVEKTGDRIVLPDLESGKAVVVMDLDAYERLHDAAMLSAAPTVESAPSSAGDIPTPIQQTSAFAAALELTAAPVPTFRLSEEPTAPLDEVPGHRHAPAPAPSPAVPSPAGAPRSIPAQSTANIRALEDLTREELLDRVNRDIDDWKTAHDVRHPAKPRPAAYDLESSGSFGDQLEEEERFFLEPIE
jgi:hypothetical protein